MLQRTQHLVNLIHIISIEALATFRYVIPARLRWLIKRHFTQEILAYTLCPTTGAQLYLHTPLDLKAHEEFTPVLFLHGDYGHPSTLWHLTEQAKKEFHGPLFSLYLPTAHRVTEFEVHQGLIGQALAKIESLGHEKGSRFKGILGVGHSKGAILLAQRLFSSSCVLGVFAIAGRLNAPDNDSTCHPSLKASVKQIYLNSALYPEKPLFQIIPDQDWNAPREAMAIRPLSHCYTVPGMHLSCLYSSTTASYFKNFLDTKF